MGYLLKRKCFMSDFTNIKLYRKMPSWSHSLPLFEKTFRQLCQARRSYICLPSVQYSTIKQFPYIMDRKSLSSNCNQRCILINQLKNNCLPGHRSLNKDHFSSESFCENVGVATTGNYLNNGINDSTLRVQVDSLREKLQNSTSVDEILSLAEEARQTDSLHSDCFSVLFSSYQEQVYKMLTFPWLFPELHLKRKQIELNFLIDQTIAPYTTDTRFQNLIAHAEMLIGDISYGDCVNILNSLHYLFINSVNSNFARKLVDKCSENLNKFNLNQLAVFSSNLQPLNNETYLRGKIVNAAKIWLTTRSASQDIDLGDLCDLFINSKRLASNDMCELGAEIINSKLASNPSSVTLDMIIKANLFIKAANSECEESLLNGLLNLPPQCFTSDATNTRRMFNICTSIGGNSWLSPISQKLLFCILDLNTSNHETINEMVKFFLLLKSHSVSDTQNDSSLLIQLVKKSDNFQLFQLMLSHQTEELGQLPESREILLAYHMRLTTLFASLSQAQQQKLMWKSNGFVGRLVFNMFYKFKDAGIPLNQDLKLTLESHFNIQSNDWDVSHSKTIIAALHSFKRLKSNSLLAPDDLSALLKFLHRLDLIYLMDLYKKFDLLSLMQYLSVPVKQQCLEVRKKVYNSFQSKLSGTDTLASYFLSSKMVPYARKKHSWKMIGSDTFNQLMNSLPRLLKNEDDKNYLRILSLLDLSCERFPVYQKETFEKLISFVTSSSKLLMFSGIQLVKILACSGHQPENWDSFTAWSLLLSTQAMEHMMIRKSMLVQLSYYLSVLGIFHDTLLLKIFSLDFLLALDEELEEEALAAQVKSDLALLNRSVSIECPHLAVPWFSRQWLFNDAKSKSSNTFDLSSVIESINRLTRQTGYVVTSAGSPYAHHIDALMYFDPSSGLVRCDNVQNSQPLPDIEKIALLGLQSHHLCYNSDFLTGKSQADIRQMQILGYTVVPFTEKELSSMEVHSEAGLDNYVRKKINDAAHSQVLCDFQE